jgi:hypothetical protein
MKKALVVIMVFCFMAGWSAAVRVDDFDSYSTGLVDTVTTNWKPIVGATAGLVSIATDPANPSNKVLDFIEDGNSGGGYGILNGDAIIANGEMKTLFYRFRTNASNTIHPTSGIGLTDVDVPGANYWSVFCTEQRLYYGTTQAISGDVIVTDPTVGVVISADTWYNVWAVVDHATNTWRLYMNSTAGANGNATTDRIGIITPGDAFRASNTNALDRFMFMSYAYSPAAHILVDDIYVMDGTNLSNPIPEPATMLLLGLGAVFLRKRK